MAKYKSPATDGQDLAAALLAFKTDLHLEVRQTFVPLAQDELEIHTLVYREVEGVKLGIYKECVVWRPSDFPILNKALGALHRAYWKASDLAHSGARPAWALGSG